MLQSKELAITFNDAPRRADGYLSGAERAKKLIDSLRKHNAGSVVFFAVSDQINEEGKKRLQQYANPGHVIANHTAGHPNFNDTSFLAYKDNFAKAHNELKGFDRFKNWFRFPFLREGNTETKRDSIRNLLAKMNYFNAYITLNNYDWYIERLFQRSVTNPDFSFDKIRDFYVKVLSESIEYYDQMAIRHLGRSPKHVLLFHEMDISALFIGDLIAELRSNGWKIITAEKAYTDVIANYHTKTVLPFKSGRVGEIARDNGQIKGLWHESCNEQYLEQRFEKEVLRQ